jgi:hypothetical protein
VRIIEHVAFWRSTTSRLSKTQGQQAEGGGDGGDEASGSAAGTAVGCARVGVVLKRGEPLVHPGFSDHEGI